MHTYLNRPRLCSNPRIIPNQLVSFQWKKVNEPIGKVSRSGKQVSKTHTISEHKSQVCIWGAAPDILVYVVITQAVVPRLIFSVAPSAVLL